MTPELAWPHAPRTRKSVYLRSSLDHVLADLALLGRPGGRVFHHHPIRLPNSMVQDFNQTINVSLDLIGDPVVQVRRHKEGGLTPEAGVHTLDDLLPPEATS